MKKSIQSLILLLAVLMVPAAANADARLVTLNTEVGDVNGDGNVTITDVTALINYLLSGDASAINLDAADCNGDGKVSITDVTALIDYLLSGNWPWVEPGVETFTVNGVSFKMITVDGGIFMMGASDDDADAGFNEKPAHKVALSSYSIGETEVTQALWLAVMGSNPSRFTGDLTRPVECVSWNDCQTFITELNQMTGMTFRLPTEAEWEFAARGGNLSQGYLYAGGNDINEVARYNGNASSQTHPVATKAPNELGLYDMSGNVFEWCSDWYGYYTDTVGQTNPQGPSSGSTRVSRGGAWGNTAAYCRVSFRLSRSQTSKNNSLGLRLVLDKDISQDTEEHEYVDLGLPSGTLWATCNVGASSPEGYGDYFAWGETEPKELYEWTTYKWCNGSYDTLTKYCTNSLYGTVDNKTELEAADDAAYINWGALWRMPSQEQFQELSDNCTWSWTTLNDVNGYLVTGPNGNRLFLPAAGIRNGASLDFADSDGDYWSCTISSWFPRSAYVLDFYSDGWGWDAEGDRYYGCTVRPVIVSPR